MIAVSIINEADRPVEQHALLQEAQTVLAHLSRERAWRLTIRLIDDAKMGELNQQFRGLAKPTDVLSFPVHTFLNGQPPQALPDGPVLLGEVVVNLAQAARQARQTGHDLVTEVKFLVGHGVRHLIGYHHD